MSCPQKESATVLEHCDAHKSEGQATTKALTPSLAPKACHVKLLALWTAMEGAILAGGIMALWMLPAAWAERGSRGGIGGEWLMISLAAWAGGRGARWACHWLTQGSEGKS